MNLGAPSGGLGERRDDGQTIERGEGDLKRNAVARLVDGAKTIRIFGEEIIVRASVHTIGGFSAHADKDDILTWLGGVGPAHIHLVHGENEAMNEFASFLRNDGRKVTIPEYGERIPLFDVYR